ncbi:MAG: hypothetical protein HOB27_06085 [Candidatus Marinimicrobia bacterium]|jgi:hypothetical protein|nr:hypothetical protein [Candidatus Neomarinimicrobiota bacterium]
MNEQYRNYNCVVANLVAQPAIGLRMVLLVNILLLLNILVLIIGLVV